MLQQLPPLVVLLRHLDWDHVLPWTVTSRVLKMFEVVLPAVNVGPRRNEVELTEERDSSGQGTDKTLKQICQPKFI